MKKSLVFALALAAAFGAKAAVVDWQYKITDQADQTVPGYTAYLVSQADWNDISADGIASQDEISNKALDSTTFISNGSTGKNANKVYNFSTKNNSNLAGARMVDVGEAASLNAIIVLFDTSKGTDGAYFTSPSLTLESRDTTGQAGTSGVVSSTAAAVSGGTWTPVQPVPEPTSVALLALGLAALGLKRKVA